MTPYRKIPRLFFDIETEVNPGTLPLMPEPKIEAPANYKDPVKIAEYIVEKTASAKQEQIDRAPLDPDYGRILSIGYSTGENIHVIAVGDEYEYTVPNRETGEVDHCVGKTTEDMILMEFWSRFADCDGQCVGYSVISFDLPYLLRRSMALGVRVPFAPNLAKFRTEPVTDLMQILYNWGGDKFKGLKQVARLYGLPNDCPGVDGSKVKSLSPDELKAYQASDVKLVMALYDRMNGVYFSH